jgi:hypothetical protein
VQYPKQQEAESSGYTTLYGRQTRSLSAMHYRAASVGLSTPQINVRMNAH